MDESIWPPVIKFGVGSVAIGYFLPGHVVMNVLVVGLVLACGWVLYSWLTTEEDGNLIGSWPLNDIRSDELFSAVMQEYLQQAASDVEQDVDDELSPCSDVART